MRGREAMYDEIQTLRQINRKSKTLEEAQAKLIQELSAEIEGLERDLALAQIRIEELMADLAEEREGRDG